MMKSIAVLFVLALTVGADQHSDAAKKDLARFQGEWKAEKAEREGESTPAEELARLKVIVAGDSLSIDVGDARLEKATITLDPSKTPPTIDMKAARQGKETLLGIYKLDGDKLTLCWAKEGKRPSEFATKKDTMQALLVLKRVTK